ncbi:MAG TPA: glycosyltransferase family 2 protein [Candidatus Saccharimonadia bacterium]|nr:glycosyltransferase family 2 protein [Candidatus Saccharimonadia bacterium]
MSVSVVIANYNGKHLLQKHLPKVFAALGPRDEVIVVDDASTDNSVSFLQSEFPHVNIVKNEHNMRYAMSCNLGVQAAKHEIVILLNNDVSPEANFLDALLSHFENPDVFAVGCLEFDDHGKESGRSIGHFDHGMLSHMRAPDQNKHVSLWAAGGSMAVRKSLWEKFGGFDRLFRPAYKEDIDLSYRAWKAGYIVAFEPRSRVHHQHESTNTTALGKNEIEITSYKNEFLFLWKNLGDFDLMASHLFWLIFYMLPVLGIKTHGRIVLGLIRAKFQGFELLRSRYQAKKLWKISDREVIVKANQ